MTLYGPFKDDLLRQLTSLECELATLEAAFAAASDAERYGLSEQITDTINAIDEVSAGLDDLDECGFWRDRA